MAGNSPQIFETRLSGDTTLLLAGVPAWTGDAVTEERQPLHGLMWQRLLVCTGHAAV
ncbi:MAG: hypothetical protein QOI03_2371 [Solirubrobacteraceae bacterium]|jgi:hypothetical protein|nr:hypothetical protein [Solirubrobacteraceae bacterium]